MIQNRTRNSLLLLLALVCLFLTHACKKPSDGVEITVNTDVTSSHMLIRFADAKNELAGIGDFDVTIGGKDAALVTDNYGTTTFRAEDGFLELALQKAAQASVQKPVTFTVAAKVAGYAPVTQTITVTSDSSLEQTIDMVSYTNAADGTATLQQQSALTNGVPAVAINLATSTNATLSEIAKITIPAGTKFYDAAGTQIVATQLTTRVVFYGAGNENALRLFPGGLNPTNIIGPNGLIDGGASFITAGLVQIDMEAGGKEVKSFSQPISVTTEIKNDLVNPQTGVAVAAGDIIPIWSFNATTGQWKYETTATVTGNGGKKQVQYGPTHLSAWNADWSYNLSANPLTVKVIMPEDQAGTYWLEMLNSSSSYLGGLYADNSWAQGVYFYNGQTLTVPRPVNIDNVKLVLFRQRGYDIMAQTSLFNPSKAGTITLTVPVPVNLPPVSKVNLNLEAKCVNKDINVRLSTFVRLYKLAGNDYRYYKAIYISNGNTRFALENNQRYRVEAYYGNSKYAAIVDYKSANYNFSASTANGKLSGSAVYNSANNTYSTTGIIAVNCR